MEKYRNYSLVLEECESYITDYFDEIGSDMFTLACTHKRYNLGNKQYYSDVEMLQDILDTEVDDIRVLINRFDKSNKFIKLPLYMYEHSGIVLNTIGFSSLWDSGQIGYIYISKDKIREMYGCSRVSKKLKETILNMMVEEVKEYSAYLSGEKYAYDYRYLIKNEKGDELYNTDFYYTKDEALEESKLFIDLDITNRKSKYLF